MSKEQEKFAIPKVERIVEFEEKDFNDEALVICDGNTIHRYDNEMPIVYYCGELDDGYGPENRLNTFIDSITVSKVKNGTICSLWVDEALPDVEKKARDTVVYFKDCVGRRNMILQHDIFELLKKKPNLVVSSEGVLVFYTRKQILATCDCVHYAWDHDIDTDGFKNIVSIESKRGYCEVKVEDCSDFIRRKRLPIKSYKLKFNIDMLSRGLIACKVT